MPDHLVFKPAQLLSSYLDRGPSFREGYSGFGEEIGVSGCFAAEGRRSLGTVIDGPRGLCVRHG